MKNIIGITAIFIFCFPFVVSAAPSYTVAPLVIDVESEARDIQTFDITLRNTGTAPLTVYPTVNNITVAGGGTIESFLPPVSSDRTSSLTSWLEITRSGVKLAVGETKIVTLTLRVNPSPQPGEYHAFIGFGSGRNDHFAKEQVRTGGAPGTILTVRIVDKKSELLKLSRFIIDRFITSSENESARYIIKNPGDVPLTPKGEIIFYDNRGEEVSSLVVNEESAEIPPGGEKEFRAQVPMHGLFGKYKAFLNVEYGSVQRASVQDTAFFYVFPLMTILIVLGVISVVVVIISLYVHKRYLDGGTQDDSDTIPLYVKETRSESKEHDIDLKKP